MKNFKFNILASILFLLMLTACGGSGKSFVSCPDGQGQSADGQSCIVIVPDPEPLQCIEPQVLNEAGDSCIDPEPEVLVCESPKVLNESDDVCIDPPIVDFIDPYGVTLYVKGGMNDWGSVPEAAFQLIGDSQYMAAFTIQAGTYEFKIADEAWSADTDFGTDANGAYITLGQPLNMAGTGSNINIVATSTSRYQFILNATDPVAPILTVNLETVEETDPTTAEFYLRGTMNNWASNAEYLFNRTSETTLQLTVSLDKGNYEFKIADESWATATNFGGAAGDTQLIVENNTLSVGASTSGLLMVLKSSGDVSFDLDVSNATAPMLNVTGDLSETDRRAPSPNESFNQLRIYQVMVEAFQDGDPSADYDAGWGNSMHKGDLKGITAALPYIQSLGMNAIWLTPIFDSESIKDGSNTHRLDATGYFTRNYFAIDPNFGTLEDAREMVDAAHELGIYVFFDGVFGHHKGNPTASPTGLLPSGANNPVDYPQSLPFYQQVATYWIDELGIDGWRLDQADQVPIEMWEKIRLAVEAKVTERVASGEEWGILGYMVAERFSTNVEEITSQIYGDEDLIGLKSAFDFPMRFTMVDVFAGNSPASNLQSTFVKQLSYPEFTAPNLFLTNHDVPRFGDLLQRTGISGKDDPEYWLRYRIALSFLAAYTGPITLYYGDEIGDEVDNFIYVPADCGNEGRYCEDHVSRSDGKISDFDSKQAALKDYWTSLMTMRKTNAALWNGTAINLMATETAYADLKVKDENKVLYTINLAEEDEVIILTQEMVGGTRLDQIMGDITINATNGNYSITIPALTSMFFLVE